MLLQCNSLYYFYAFLSYSILVPHACVFSLPDTRIHSSPLRLLTHSALLAILPPPIRLMRRNRSFVAVKDRCRASLRFEQLRGATRTASQGSAGELLNLGGTFEIDSFEASLRFHSILLRVRLERGQLSHLLEFLSVRISLLPSQL